MLGLLVSLYLANALGVMILLENSKVFDKELNPINIEDQVAVLLVGVFWPVTLPLFVFVLSVKTIVHSFTRKT
jgi:hypothetical protein